MHSDEALSRFQQHSSGGGLAQQTHQRTILEAASQDLEQLNQGQKEGKSCKS